MNLHLDITPIGLALALLIALAVTLVILARRTSKSIDRLIDNTEALLHRSSELSNDLDATGRRIHEALTAYDASGAEMQEVTTARFLQLVQISTANNEALAVLCQRPARLKDPTVIARLRQSERDVHEAATNGLPPDVAKTILDDLAAEMEADQP